MVYRIAIDGLIVFVRGSDEADANLKAEQLALEIRAAGRSATL
jgi:hypothetical protein